MKKKSLGLSVFHILNAAFMVLVCISFIYPFIYCIAISFSSSTPILQGKVWLYPVQFTLAAYNAVFRDAYVMKSFYFTVWLTLIGVAGSLIATTITAYPLSKRDLKGKNLILNMIIFTMYFGGGLIPTFLVVKGAGLVDKMGALIIPTLISSFLLFIMINYFRGLPLELEESAKLDGANNFRILCNVIIPLSMPIIATLTIYYAVGYWNTFYSALIYMRSPEHFPLQVKLYTILLNTYWQANSNDPLNAQVLPENLKGSIIVITVLPILMVYPFLQKHFIKGVTIGALKG